jgi:hypothetical protein
MTIRLIALLAMCVPICLRASNLPAATLGVYYSFDKPPSAAMVTEMQTEVNRILGDSTVRVAWRALHSPRNGEDFPEVVVFQFRGACSIDRYPGANEDRAEVGGPLGRTDVSNGQVLPFGTVDCDKLRSFLAPALTSLDLEHRNADLGRAIARVVAHEIYHMLTKSEGHAREGIARASYTRRELTAASFGCALKEANQLHAWASGTDSRSVVEAAATEQTDPSEPASSAAESLNTTAGR